MKALEKAARALYESWANVPACSDSKPWEERAAKMPASAEMFRRHARAVIASIEVDDAMSKKASEAANMIDVADLDEYCSPKMARAAIVEVLRIMVDGEGR